MSETKPKKARQFVRTGPPCTPETAPHGCGRPLPVANVPKTEADLAKLQARFDRDAARLLAAKGMTVKTVAQAAAEKIVAEQAAAAAKAAKEAAKA